MLTFRYEIKGMNLRTTAFKEHILREAQNSKYALTADIQDRSINDIEISITGNDTARMNKFINWLKIASKGASKVRGVRKL